MILFRSRLRAIALVLVSVVSATVTLGALRPCWGTEHRHGGVAEPACAMHHGAGPLVDGHDHHGHAHEHPKDDGPQIACNCANDTDAPLLTASAIITTPVSILASAEGDPVAAPSSPRLPDSGITPLSPPPRSSFS